MPDREVDPEKQAARQAAKDLIAAAKMKQMGEATELPRREPRLIADGKLQRCSVCGYPFPPDVRPSMTVAFAMHLFAAHKPGP